MVWAQVLEDIGAIIDATIYIIVGVVVVALVFVMVVVIVSLLFVCSVVYGYGSVAANAFSNVRV